MMAIRPPTKGTTEEMIKMTHVSLGSHVALWFLVMKPPEREECGDWETALWFLVMKPSEREGCGDWETANA